MEDQGYAAEEKLDHKHLSIQSSVTHLKNALHGGGGLATMPTTTTPQRVRFGMETMSAAAWIGWVAGQSILKRQGSINHELTSLSIFYYSVQSQELKRRRLTLSSEPSDGPCCFGGAASDEEEAEAAGLEAALREKLRSWSSNLLRLQPKV